METLTKIFTKDLTEDSVWIFNTPSEAAKSFLLYVQELGLFRAKSKYYTRQEGIASYLIMLTLSGTGEYRDADNRFKLTRGTLVFADSMESHTHFTAKSSKEPWQILWVQFSGYLARGYFSQYKTKNVPYLNADSNPKIRLLLEKLVSVNKTKSIGAEFLSSKLLVDLLTEILFTAGAVISPQANAPAFINTALKDIDAHFSQDLSLDYFAKKLIVSKFHFAKEFKKYTGFSPMEYVIGARINSAKQLLQHSDLSVAQIAQTVGFHSACHFINIFKQKTGVTPLQFKKQYRPAPK